MDDVDFVNVHTHKNQAETLSLPDDRYVRRFLSVSESKKCITLPSKVT